MSEPAAQPPKRTVLHVGCGPANPKKLHKAFRGPRWQEVRYDIDPAVKPDIVGSITEMSKLRSDSFDAIYCSHSLEHLHSHQVPIALSEFHRVLKPRGFVLITLPDLQKVAEEILQDKLGEVAYIAPAGPVRVIDLLYGWPPAISRGNEYMAHRTGFTSKTLAQALRRAGFAAIQVQRAEYDLWARGDKLPGGAKTTGNFVMTLAEMFH